MSDHGKTIQKNKFWRYLKPHKCQNKAAALLISLLFALAIMPLFLSGCSLLPKKSPDSLKHPNGPIRVGDFLEIKAPKGLTLLDNKDTLSAEGLYYASWTDGSRDSFEKSDGDAIDFYDAQLYLLAGEGTDHASAEKNYQTWLAAAEGNYDVQTKEMIACNGQDYTFLSYDCANKDNPYSRGVSAFCVSDHLAVCAELTCKKDYEKDLKELLTDFLNGCHYLE